MRTSFEYKTAPIGKVQRVVVDAENVRTLDANGNESARIRFADVSDGRFVTSQSRYGTSRRLDLWVGKEVFRLGMNCATDTSAAEGPLAEFYAACAATLTALQRVQPHLNLELGEGSRMRWIWFAMCLFALLLGIALPIVALATGVRTEKILSGLVPMTILILIGIVGCRIHRPWRPGPRVSIRTLIGTFREAGRPNTMP